MAVTIDVVQVVATEAGPGDDTWFVALCGAGKTGWYGPVNAETAKYVRERLARVVTGEPADDHRRLHAALCEATLADTTAAASWAVGALDCAAWDLHAQVARQPVAQLLAASPQFVVPLYASWLGLDLSLPTAAAEAKRVGDGEWLYTKWGLRSGAGKGRIVEAARLAATTQAVAATLGVAAAFDAVSTWDARLADLVAQRLDRAEVLWLEDPLPTYDLEAHRVLAGRVPLAIGERLLLHGDGEALIGLRPRALTLDVVACGGITRAVDLVTAAHARGVVVYPHGRSFVPAVHLAAAFPEAIPAIEYRLQWEPIRQRKYACPWQPAQGVITVPSSPGLGATPGSR